MPQRITQRKAYSKPIKVHIRTQTITTLYYLFKIFNFIKAQIPIVILCRYQSTPALWRMFITDTLRDLHPP